MWHCCFISPSPHFKAMRCIIQMPVVENILTPRNIILSSYHKTVNAFYLFINTFWIFGCIWKNQFYICSMKQSTIIFSLPADAIRWKHFRSYCTHNAYAFILKYLQHILNEILIYQIAVLMKIYLIFSISTLHSLIITITHGFTISYINNIYAIPIRNHNIINVNQCFII